MLTSIEMNGIKRAISMAKTGGPSSFVMRYRIFVIAHSDAYQSWSIRKGYEGKEIFTVMAEYVDEDTLTKVFADFLEYYLGKTGCYFYPPNTAQATYTSYKYAQPSYYSASTNYISLEERVKRLEEKAVKSEKFFDTIKEVEEAIDDIESILDQWEEMDHNPSMAYSGMEAIKDILDKLEED